jgi:hypothetical protein
MAHHVHRIAPVGARVLIIGIWLLVDRPVSKARYYVGLAIILLSWLPAYIYAYAPAAMPGGNTRIYILAAMDLAFVASVFLMGGEFWEKVRRIFIYEGKV